MELCRCSILSDYLLDPEDCCVAWNLGLHCDPARCLKNHACLWSSCATLFHVDHRAIQHTPEVTCLGHVNRLQGINTVFPEAILLSDRSSKEDTLEACKKYKVKAPSLNATLFRTLLAGTEISPTLQKSLVAG